LLLASDDSVELCRCAGVGTGKAGDGCWCRRSTLSLQGSMNSGATDDDEDDVDDITDDDGVTF